MTSPDVRGSGAYGAPDVFASGDSVDFTGPAEPSEERISVPAIPSHIDKETSFFVQSTGSCNAMSAQHLVHEAWTFADLKKLATSDFFGTGKLNRQLHMSDIYNGDIELNSENVTGWICFESLGEYENRRFADWLSDNCVDTLKISEDKCEALEGVVETYAKDTKAVAALKEMGRDVRLFIVFSAVGVSGYLFLRGGGGSSGGEGGGGGISRKALVFIGGALAAVGAISVALQLFARIPPTVLPDNGGNKSAGRPAVSYPTLKDALSAPSANRVPLVEPWQLYASAGIAAAAATLGLATFVEIPAAAAMVPAAAF
ncbi:MAG: hypothetical protein HYT75_02760 [Deltaproteobacteria bacterium]|nr:hypothetical protein [Deltaproteobacteria bacterium]MBI2341247.1 hypothetical protein [Deltaproteobacteria bacterium]